MPMSDAGTVLRDARHRAGLTQVQLAQRAGLTQSVISAYESGQRQPALSTLSTLIDATGYELDVQLRRTPRRLDGLTGPIGRRVRQQRHALLAAAHSHGVTNLRVFGSVARGEDGPDSDVDLIAELPATMGLFGLARVRNELEAILDTRLDLVSSGDLKPDVHARVDREAIRL
jgi:uncharacterized protein